MSYNNSYYRERSAQASRRRKKKRVIKFLCLIGIIGAVVTSFLLLHTSRVNETNITNANNDTAARPAMAMPQDSNSPGQTVESNYKKPIIQVNLLDPNPFSRPQTPLTKVNGIVIHYVGNPGTTAKANRNYFNRLAETQDTYASSHFIIDMDGTIIQCIPTTEIAYASNNRNEDTISIEVCHPDKTGKFTDQSYKSLVSLTGWLCSQFNVNSNDVIRHYDVTGKLCPLYFVEHEDAWLAFKNDVFSK